MISVASMLFCKCGNCRLVPATKNVQVAVSAVAESNSINGMLSRLLITISLIWMDEPSLRINFKD